MSDNEKYSALPANVRIELLERDEKFQEDFEKASKNAKPLMEKWHKEFVNRARHNKPTCSK